MGSSTTAAGWTSRVLSLLAGGRSLAKLPGVAHWRTAAEGLRATDSDVLVEARASPAADGEPGTSHMREALGRGIPVVTSNQWPVALHGVELTRLARGQGAVLRAESTVMSGTPVLGPLTEGLAGATPLLPAGSDSSSMATCRMRPPIPAPARNRPGRAP